MCFMALLLNQKIAFYNKIYNHNLHSNVENRDRGSTAKEKI